MVTFIYGAYGTGNLGDDALLKAALECHRGKDVRIVSYGLPFLRKKYNYISHNDFVANPHDFISAGDSVVFAGGGLFWASTHVDDMAKVARAAVDKKADVSVERIGAQGVHCNLESARIMMEACSSITVRDHNSVDLLARLGVTDRAMAAEDYALLIQDKPVQNKSTGKLRIGINHSATPFFYEEAHRRKALHIYAEVSKRVADVASIYYIPHVRHFRVMPQNDIVYGEYFWNASKGRISPIIFPETVEDLLLEYGRLDAVVGWRYHLLVLGTLMGLPAAFLGQPGEHKYGAFSSEIGLPQINFDLDTHQVIASVELFIRRVSNSRQS